MDEDEASLRTQITLQQNEEWRFEVQFGSKLFVKLLEGTAELFGCELARGRDYEFSGHKAAIFTYHGCKLEFSGECENKIAVNPVMLRYANVHFALENIRAKAALDASVKYPRTLVLGPPNSGKSTLCKILASYASKLSHFPILVNLDPATPLFSPPGSLSATPISHVLDIEDTSGQPPINGPALTRHKQSLVYDYALNDFNSSPLFYNHLIKLLAHGINERIDKDLRVKQSGLIVDPPSDLSLESIQYICETMEINNILVIGDSALAVNLKSKLSITIGQLPASDGCVALEPPYTRSLQRVSIQNYFFGNSRQILSPFTTSVPLNDVIVYRPVEQNEDSSQGLLIKITPSAILQNSVLAIVNADLTASVNEVANAETTGFVYVSEADEAKKILKILVPVPGKLPQRPLIMGSFKYHD